MRRVAVVLAVLAASEERPGDIDSHEVMPRIEIERVGVAATADPRIVDENIGVRPGGGQFRPRGIFRHVQTVEGRLSTIGGDLLRLRTALVL